MWKGVVCSVVKTMARSSWGGSSMMGESGSYDGSSVAATQCWEHSSQRYSAARWTVSHPPGCLQVVLSDCGLIQRLALTITFVWV